MGVIFIQEVGECCGFGAWKDTQHSSTIHWENNVCGHGVLHSGHFSRNELDAALLALEKVEFIDGEGIIPINDEVEIVVDEYDNSVFNLRRR